MVAVRRALSDSSSNDTPQMSSYSFLVTVVGSTATWRAVVVVVEDMRGGANADAAVNEVAAKREYVMLRRVVEEEELGFEVLKDVVMVVWYFLVVSKIRLR